MVKEKENKKKKLQGKFASTLSCQKREKKTPQFLRVITAPFYNQNTLLNRSALGKHELQHENH